MESRARSLSGCLGVFVSAPLLYECLCVYVFVCLPFSLLSLSLSLSVTFFPSLCRLVCVCVCVCVSGGKYPVSQKAIPCLSACLW